jgi:hypothetical protein
MELQFGKFRIGKEKQCLHLDTIGRDCEIYGELSRKGHYLRVQIDWD